MENNNQRCQVYLIHFERRYFHAQHYLGFSSDLAHRLFEHDTDQGAKLIAAINEAGIDWQVVRTWDVPAFDQGGWEFELRLKARKDARSLCPLCCQQRAARKARQARARRQQPLLPFIAA